MEGCPGEGRPRREGALEGEPAWLPKGRRSSCVGGRHRSGHVLKKRTRPRAGSWELDGKGQVVIVVLCVFFGWMAWFYCTLCVLVGGDILRYGGFVFVCITFLVTAVSCLHPLRPPPPLRLLVEVDLSRSRLRVVWCTMSVRGSLPTYANCTACCRYSWPAAVR